VGSIAPLFDYILPNLTKDATEKVIHNQKSIKKAHGLLHGPGNNKSHGLLHGFCMLTNMW
jgi:hypothetical protein